MGNTFRKQEESTDTMIRIRIKIERLHETSKYEKISREFENSYINYDSRKGKT